MAREVNIVCMKWGRRYPAVYVNNLFRSLSRRLARPFRFLCITEDPGHLLPGIETSPFPPNPGVTGADWPNVFMKLEITRDGFANRRQTPASSSSTGFPTPTPPSMATAANASTTACARRHGSPNSGTPT